MQQKNDLAAQLQELEKNENKGKENFSTYTNSFISLLVSLPEDQEIREIVLKTKKSVNEIHQRTLDKTGREQSRQINQAFANFAGWPACKSCHKPQTDFWRKTAHEKAWRTLVMKNQQYNPECLICHVTLPTYDKNTVTKQNLLANVKEEYKGVGCESCHGPAKAHTLQPELNTPKKPDEKTCLICHTPERDDNFIFSEKVKKIRCPASGH